MRLVRDRRGGPAGNAFSLSHYVNDRPYAVSSFTSAAIGRMFGTAMTGRSKDRPQLAEQELPLSVRLPVLPCRGGEPVVRTLFEPLGYTVAVSSIALDETIPQHLFVLLPVLDDDKHYWVGRAEIDKLLRRGGDWLGAHPERELITRRYLRHDRRLTRDALAQLIEADRSTEDPDQAQQAQDAQEAAIERPVRLAEQRIDAVSRRDAMRGRDASPTSAVVRARWCAPC